MKKVYYLAYFDIPENAEQNRNYVLSATTKSTYICRTLAKLGYDVTIVSASATKSNRFCKGKDVQLGDNLKLHLFDSLPSGNVVRRVLSRAFMKKQITAYLMKNITPEDVLIVYHSLSYCDIVKNIKKQKNPLLVVENNEIYSDVTGDTKTRTTEMRFLQSADAYIFSTELLNDKININNKPFAVNYGTYDIEPDRKCKFEDGKIHAVYAGTFDPRKGGAVAASAAAGGLGFNYHIHIIGFGSEKEKKDMQDFIRELSKKTDAEVSYDGLLSGEDYIRFLQSCDIGFSTQSTDGQFNETSFPLKVLSYLSNGLRVVSVRIKAIETSKVSEAMYFYDENTPSAIANAIKSIDFNDNYDGRKIVKELDDGFKKAIKNILK